MPLRKMMLTAVCLCIASCASPLPRMVGELEQKPVCCQSLDQMEFVPLQGDKDTRVRLDQGSSVFAFVTGKSYFRAFRLPSNLGANDLEVTTYSSGASVYDVNAFYPQFLLLDSQHQIRRALPSQGYRYKMDTLRGANWSTRLSFETGDAYLVVYTSPAVFEYGLPYPASSGYAGVIGSTPYFSPGSPAGFVPLGPTGSLVLRWLKREPTRSTARAGDPGKLAAMDHPGVATLSGSALERSLVDWDGFQVVTVDGKSVDYGWTGNPFKMPIQLSPGEHTALVFFRTTKGYAMAETPDAYFQVTAKFEAGRWYRVVGSLDNGLVTAWTEDAQNGNRVSEQVTASMYWQTPFGVPDATSR